MSYCKIIAHGRVVKDLELMLTPAGIPYTRFTLACSRKMGKDKEPVTEYVNFVAWRGAAETLAKYAAKGSELLIEGQFTSYKKQVDGEQYPRVNVEFTVDEFDFCGNRKTNDGGAAAPASQAPAPQAPAYSAAAQSDFGGYGDFEGDPGDLPF